MVSHSTRPWISSVKNNGPCPPMRSSPGPSRGLPQIFHLPLTSTTPLLLFTRLYLFPFGLVHRPRASGYKCCSPSKAASLSMTEGEKAKYRLPSSSWPSGENLEIKHEIRVCWAFSRSSMCVLWASLNARGCMIRGSCQWGHSRYQRSRPHPHG